MNVYGYRRLKRRNHRVLRDRISQLAESSNCDVLSTRRTLIAFPATATSEDSFCSDYRNIDDPFTQVPASAIANYVLNYRATLIAEYLQPANRTFKRDSTKIFAKPVFALRARYPIRKIPFIFHCSFKFQDPRVFQTTG